MDVTQEDPGALATAFSCASCGAELGPTAKFCGECGAGRPGQPGYVVNEIAVPRHRYRAMATSLGFEGHMAMAKAMP